jgi:hypothetical protein
MKNINLHEDVTTTFRFRNMSASPPVQWSEQEQESGAISFSKHLAELHHKLTTTTTTTPTTVIPPVTRSPVEKFSHAVEVVVPQLVETLRHEFVDPPTAVPPTSIPAVTTTPFSVSTPPPTTPTHSTNPPVLCNRTDSTQVR